MKNSQPIKLTNGIPLRANHLHVFLLTNHQYLSIHFICIYLHEIDYINTFPVRARTEFFKVVCAFYYFAFIHNVKTHRAELCLNIWRYLQYRSVIKTSNAFFPWESIRGLRSQWKVASEINKWFIHILCIKSAFINMLS